MLKEVLILLTTNTNGLFCPVFHMSVQETVTDVFEEWGNSTHNRHSARLSVKNKIK